jgi:hypothetical protein
MQADAMNRPAQQPGAERVNYGLNFRQLGHWSHPLQIRNPKDETRNKFEFRNLKTPSKSQ